MSSERQSRNLECSDVFRTSACQDPVTRGKIRVPENRFTVDLRSKMLEYLDVVIFEWFRTPQIREGFLIGPIVSENKETNFSPGDKRKSQI